MSGTVHLEGMLDGASVAGDFSKGEVGGALAVSLNVNFGSGGMIRIVGGIGTLRMPDDGAEPGVWFATGAGSKGLKKNGHSAFILQGLKRLGTCAAAMGTGDLAFCYDSNGSCPGGVTTTASGTVNGMPFDWGGQPNFSFANVTDHAVVVLWKNGAALFGQLAVNSSKIQNGVVWMPSGPPDSGAFWCSGKGNAYESGGGTHAGVTELKRLGTSAEGVAVTGQIEGCY